MREKYPAWHGNVARVSLRRCLLGVSVSPEPVATNGSVDSTQAGHSLLPLNSPQHSSKEKTRPMKDEEARKEEVKTANLQSMTPHYDWHHHVERNTTLVRWKEGEPPRLCTEDDTTDNKNATKYTTDRHSPVTQPPTAPHRDRHSNISQTKQPI